MKIEETLIRDICARFDNKPDALLEILHEVQTALKFLDDSTLNIIADAVNISRADIVGVVSFYDDFRRSPPAKTVIKICGAEACQAVGCRDLIERTEKAFQLDAGQRNADGDVELKTIYCLGNCALGPAVMVDGRLYGRMTAERLKHLVNSGESSA